MLSRPSYKTALHKPLDEVCTLLYMCLLTKLWHWASLSFPSFSSSVPPDLGLFCFLKCQIWLSSKTQQPSSFKSFKTKRSRVMQQVAKRTVEEWVTALTVAPSGKGYQTKSLSLQDTLSCLTLCPQCCSSNCQSDHLKEVLWCFWSRSACGSQYFWRARDISSKNIYINPPKTCQSF